MKTPVLANMYGAAPCATQREGCPVSAHGVITGTHVTGEEPKVRGVTEAPSIQ